jgi:hypothetical protein
MSGQFNGLKSLIMSIALFTIFILLFWMW